MHILKNTYKNITVKDFNSVLYSLIGEKLKYLRLEKSLSQTALSDKIPNIGRTSISNIEKGEQKPPLHVIYLICNELDVDIHSILPTYSDVMNEIESLSDDKIFDYINENEIDEKTKQVLQELLNIKPKK